MFTLSAGCGIPILICGPQYAWLVPGSGPGVEVEDVAGLLGELAACRRRSVPCCTGIRSTGTGMSGTGAGTTSGMMPNAAYLARMTAPAASGVMPG